MIDWIGQALGVYSIASTLVCLTYWTFDLYVYRMYEYD